MKQIKGMVIHNWISQSWVRTHKRLPLFHWARNHYAFRTGLFQERCCHIRTKPNWGTHGI